MGIIQNKQEIKLLSMTDFVLEQNNFKVFRNQQILNYANFLKQPLELWMFVACDGNWNVLEEPYNYQEYLKGDSLNTLCEDYFKAKERCLFEGFEWKINKSFAEEIYGIFDKKNDRFICAINIGMTIEDLVCINSKLTPTAIKQLGL